MNTGDLERRLADLEDRFAIEELRSAFARFTDERRWQDLAGLFTADGAFDPGEPVTGRAAIGEAASQLSDRWEFWWHYVSNGTVAVTGDTARGSAYFQAPFKEAGVSRTAMGRYEDELVKEDGGWRFRRRRLVFSSAASPGEGWGTVPEGMRSVAEA